MHRSFPATRHYVAARTMSCLNVSCAVMASALLAVLSNEAAGQEDAYLKARLKMIEERVEREGVKNERVLNALRQVPRHLFVVEKLRPHAYNEEILDIGYKQTLSTAYIVGYMTA